MAINDDVDREYGPIDTVPVLRADGGMVPNTNRVPETDVFEEPTVANELPKFEGVFNIHNDTANKINDLSSIRGALARNCAVCAEDAVAIDTIAPGFLSAENPVGLFTEEPSKAQYEQTMQSVDAELDAQYQSLKNSVIEVSTRLYTFASECSKQYTGRYINLMSDINRSIARLLFACERDEVGEIAYIFGNKQKWSQLQSVPLSTLSGEYAIVASDTPPKTGFEGSFIEPFLQRFAEQFKTNTGLLRTLEHLYIGEENVLFINNVRSSFDENAVTLYRETAGDTIQASPPSLTLGMLFHLLRSNRLVTFINALQALHQNRIHLLVDLPEQIKQVDANPDDSTQGKINAVVALSSIGSHVHFDSMNILSTLSALFKLMTALRDCICAMSKTQEA